MPFDLVYKLNLSKYLFMKVWVKNIKGEHFMVDLQPKDNAKMMAFKIANAGIAKKTDLHLFYNSQGIEPGETVQSLQIQPWQVITVFGSPNVYVPFNVNKQNNPMFQMHTSSQKEQEKKPEYVPDEDIVRQLMRLNYGREHIQQALTESRGDVAKAIQILNRNHSPSPMVMLPGSGNMAMMPGLNPGSDNMAMMPGLNPGLGNMAMMPGLNPGLGNMMMMPGLNFGLSSNAGNLTPQDKAIIDKISQMGFDKGKVTEKYFENGQSEEETINALIMEGEDEENQYNGDGDDVSEPSIQDF